MAAIAGATRKLHLVPSSEKEPKEDALFLWKAWETLVEEAAAEAHRVPPACQVGSQEGDKDIRGTTTANITPF